VFKGMLKVSRRPLDSIGFGIGLRGNYFKRFGLDFDFLTPFVGMTFTKQDQTDATGAEAKSSRNSEVRLGR
jgi:hypothetical protein